VAAEHLKEAGELRVDEQQHLEELLEWFRLHLPVPHVSQRDERAIYWYKPSAKQHIGRMWELARFLELHGYDVEMVTTAFAGLAIYQDDFQIGAIPQIDRHR
jgi:hypothetical protein